MIATETSLAQLMARAQNGDAAAYRVLLQECQRWLGRYFARRIMPVQVDDLIQDTLISVHAKRATFDPARPFLPWLAAIARYRWIDHLRKVYRADETLLDEQMAGESEEPGIIARISIDHLLDQLPPAQQVAIRLVKIEGLSIAEASGQCGQSEPLVKVNIHRGIKKLAALVESEG
jgi:RNA polymerase sigma factor (sigma-70 family)